MPVAGVAEGAVVAVPALTEAGEDEARLVSPVDGGSVSAEDVWSWCDTRPPYFAAPRSSPS